MIAEVLPDEPAARRWATRTLGSPTVEPSRPRRHAPVDVTLHESDMANAFQLLADAGGFNLVMADHLEGRVSATLRSVDPYEALEAVAAAHGVEVRYDGRVVVVRKR